LSYQAALPNRHTKHNHFGLLEVSPNSKENSLSSELGFSFHGIIISATRRTVTAIPTDASLFRDEIILDIPNRWEPLIVGDKVEITQNNLLSKDYRLTKHLQRANVLRRAYEGRTKLIAANLNHIYLVMAPPPLWNNLFIDRTIVAAANESIPVTLICNKADIESSEMINNLFRQYRSITHACLVTTALHQKGLTLLQTQLDSLSWQKKCAALRPIRRG